MPNVPPGGCGGIAECARWLTATLGGGCPAAGAAAVGAANAQLVPLLLLDSLDAASFLAALADGRLLRRLLRRLRQQPEKEEGDDAASATELLSEFLTACEVEFLVPADSRFQPADLAPSGAANPAAVLRCLRALSLSDAAAAAGLRTFNADAVASLAENDEDENYIEMSGGYRYDQPVLNVLDQLIGSLRTCRVLARELRESPLSLWPTGSVEVVFGPVGRLLALLTDLRGALRNEQPLDEALVVRETQLIRQYAKNAHNFYLHGAPALETMEQGRLAQVTLALAKMSQGARSAQDLLMQPMVHLRRLISSAKKALDDSKAACADEAARRLELSMQILMRAEARLDKFTGKLGKRLRPSLVEFVKLKWPAQRRPPAPEALGRLRHAGCLLSQDGKRVGAVLWDRALVLAAMGTREVMETLDVTQDLRFEETNIKTIGISMPGGISRRFSFRLTFGSRDSFPPGSPPPTTPPPTSPANQQQQRLRLLSCESAAERQAWVDALEKAKASSFPEGFDMHGHDFQLVPVTPDELHDAHCRRCGGVFGCWARKCGSRCGARMHGKCVRAACGGANPMKCLPVPMPRRNVGSASNTQQPDPQPQVQQQPQLEEQLQQPSVPEGPQQQEQLSWCEPEPIDAESATVRLREFAQREFAQRRGKPRRNFLLCPSGGPGSRQPGYQLHVLSGDSVVTYRVEPAAADGSRVRIEGEDDAFPCLSDLVKHYSTNQLPRLPGDQDDSVYDELGDMLVTDSGVADC